MKKSIVVNESSIVDLKAELFRKEENFKQQKSSDFIKKDINNQTQGSKTLEKLAALTGKKKNPLKRKSKEDELPAKIALRTIEEEKEYEKSKLALQSKAKLYEKMTKGEYEDIEEENGETLFLVDFQKKSSDIMNEPVGVEDGHSSGEEWVEFEDSLGRHRKCMKKDLDKFRSADPEFRPVENIEPQEMLPEDKHHEFLKQKWEDEKEEMLNNPEKDIHYSNIRFDEVREHGVGYYQFSRDQAERLSQLESLNKLREQTIEQRAKREQIKKKRQADLNARLAKIREKKLQKQNVAEKDQTDNSNTAESQDLADKDASNLLGDVGVPPNPLEQCYVKTTNNPFTEITPSCPGTSFESRLENQLHKPPKQTSASNWINAQRDDRNPDFAPPSIYQQPHGGARKNFPYSTK